MALVVIMLALFEWEPREGNMTVLLVLSTSAFK
jgi:hypothetical protein